MFSYVKYVFLGNKKGNSSVRFFSCKDVNFPAKIFVYNVMIFLTLYGGKVPSKDLFNSLIRSRALSPNMVLRLVKERKKFTTILSRREMSRSVRHVD